MGKLRFQKSAILLNSLVHSHFVEVQRFVVRNGLVCTWMEHLKGGVCPLFGNLCPAHAAPRSPGKFAGVFITET